MEEEHHFLVSLDTDYSKVEDSFAKIKDYPSICIYESQNSRDVVYTIAIPTYKRGDLLKEAIDSALSQVECPDYNIIVVDNNPERNDITEQMMEQYKGTIVSYYKHPINLGMGGNWNRAVELTPGKWMILLHDDDKLMPTFIHEVDKVAKLHPDAGFIQTKKFFGEKPSESIPDKVCSKFSMFDVVLRRKSIFTTSGMMYRKEAYMSFPGMPYDQYQSYALWYSLLLVRDFDCYYIDKELTYYRIGETNESTKSFLHANLIRYDYALFLYGLRCAHIPNFIALPYLQQYVINAESGWRNVWHSNFIFPKEISKTKYSQKRCNLSVKIISRLARYSDAWNDYTISQLIKKSLLKIFNR